MDNYIVNKEQNIFDVALLLYGSIEGIYDLLISNDDLNLFDELKPNTLLHYHSDFVINDDVKSYFTDNNIVPRNTVHSVYRNTNSAIPQIVIKNAHCKKIQFNISGNGQLEIDWGYGEMEVLDLSTVNDIQHDYNDYNNDTVKIYINGDVNVLDISKLNSFMYFTKEIMVRKFISKANSKYLTPLLNCGDITIIE